MKAILTVAALVCVLVLSGCATAPTAKPFKKTWSSFDQPADHPKTTASQGVINFQGADVGMCLKVYQALSGRNLIRGALPEAKIVFQSQTPLTHLQALQAFDTLLAQNGIAIIYSGEDTAKAVPVSTVTSEVLPEINLPWPLLPESSSPMLRKVFLKKLKPSTVIPLLMPFAKLPGSMLAVDDQKLLVLRDYSENIRQQLRLLEELEKKSSP